MKRLFATLSFVAAATTAALPATPAAPPGPKTTTPKKIAAKAPPCKVAPADEYFGRLKMSILGIRNTIKDQGLRIDADANSAPATLGAINLTEDAMRDWEQKYPCDGWLPGTIFALEHFYSKIHSRDGVTSVHRTFAWIRRRYVHSRFFRDAAREDGSASAAPPTAVAGTENPGPPPVMLTNGSPAGTAVAGSPAAGPPAQPGALTQAVPPPSPVPHPQ